MDENALNLLLNGTKEEAFNILRDFITENSKSFTFPNLNKENKKKLVEIIYTRLQEADFGCHHATCLEVYRILSREKRDLDELFTREILNSLIHMAGLYNEELLLQVSDTPKDFAVILEALKCLCNLIYHSKSIQRTCSSSSCLEGIMLRLKTYKDGEWSDEIKYFDMRMLFLLTALCADLRPKLRLEYHGLIYLTEVLDLIIKTNIEQSLFQSSGGLMSKRRFNRGSKRGWEQSPAPQTPNQSEAPENKAEPPPPASSQPPCLSDDEVNMACEVIKVLYNLTVNLDTQNVDEEDEAHYLRLVCILHDILLCDAKSEDKKDQLQSQTIALLMNMPPNCFEELLTPQTDVHPPTGDPKAFDFYGMNVEAVAVLLDYLDRKLEPVSLEENVGPENMPEHLTTILACLVRVSQSNRIIRRYFRSKILPPLKDVLNRPEEGSTTRNKLVRLMTSPSIQVKKLVANFLFILCKENAARLVKYTGYGNAAGLLASLGLMRGGSGGGNYSSDSEDSDTEEYLQYKEKINLVTGCYEEPRPNPMEGMTEEQKEYEAMQLVNMIDKLARDGVMKPMKIGDDGRPHAVEHILQLQEQEGDKK